MTWLILAFLVSLARLVALGLLIAFAQRTRPWPTWFVVLVVIAALAAFLPVSFRSF